MEGGMQGDGGSSASGSTLLQFKRSLKHNMSPRSPLSPQSQDYDSIDMAMQDSMVDNSIDHLYNNIYEMASSDMSPSMHSFTTYGNESRIDAELRHLVGGETEEDEKNYDEDGFDKAELLKDVVVVTKGVNKERKLVSASKKIGLEARKDQPILRAMSLGRRVDKNKPSLERRNAMNEKPPIGKRASPKGSVKAMNPASPTKEEKSLSSEDADNHPDLGPYLLKKARDVISHGDNPKKAFELVHRAKNSFEKFFDQDKKLNLDYVMCLHILASMHCAAEEYESAVPLLEKSIEIIPQVPVEQSYALAKFAGCMQLGDVYAVMGNHDSSISLYKAALDIQREVLGDKDARFGETCRYVAQAYVQALQFDEAERLCQMALETHKEPGSAISIEEAADRRLMGLICDSKGDHEVALQHYSLASLAMSNNNINGQETETAAIDCNIGDAYLALARYDEAIVSYQKALKVFKSSKGETHPSVGSVFVRLAELHYKVGKFGESRSYCEKALRIYYKPSPGSPIEEIATGLIELAAIYESMDDLNQSLKLLQKALKLQHYKGTSQQIMVAGVEAQMGVMNYMLENYNESYNLLKNAILKLQGCGENSSLQGIALNQLGLTCLQLCSIAEAAELFEEARNILHREHGPCHPDTLGVCTNLAATYDVLGRWDDAIKLLEFVVEMREEKLGTAYPVVDDEKRRLAEMLKESRRGRSKKARSLEFLLDNNNNSEVLRRS